MQKKEYEDDVLMLGGHPFHSRFILGSGKFSLSLIQTVMEYGGAKLHRLLCGVPMQTAKKTFWIFCRKILPCCRIHLVQEMQKKPFGLHGFPENWAAVIL